MAENKIGNQSVVFKNLPVIKTAFSLVGEKEGQGPMKDWFDTILQDDKCGQKTWEEAETKILKDTVIGAVRKAGMDKKDIDIIFSGDLVNQLMSSSYAVRELGIPFLGLYGACSTMSESLIIAAAFVNAGYSKYTVAAASSHFCTAERQFRMPLEHGNQKPPSAQQTVTGAGCVIMEESVGAQVIGDAESNGGIMGNACCDGEVKRDPAKLCCCEASEINPEAGRKCCCSSNHSAKDCQGMPEQGREAENSHNICVTGGTIGKIVDMGISDSNMMGAAMAPAAIDTLVAHFSDTGRSPEHYDMIFSGDLGKIGKSIVIDSMRKKGYDLSKNYEDCGCLIFGEDQDTHSGGSGCGCSGSIFCGYIVKQMRAGRWKNVLLMSTGALLSTISTQQGESIPGIAHAVSLKAVPVTFKEVGR